MTVSGRAPWRGRAQAIVEFALIMPLFVVLLFGFIDFARLEFSYISLANAAREMARTAAISTNGPDAIDDSFNNLALIASDWNDLNTTTTDTVYITVLDQCAAEATGQCKKPDGSARAPVTSPPVTCFLTPAHPSLVAPATQVRGLMHVAEGAGAPASPPTGGNSCVVPVASRQDTAVPPAPMHGGYVQIVATYHFQFNPLFNNRLTGMIDAPFLQQWATLSTTARAYIE